MIDAETQTTVADRGVLVQEAATLTQHRLLNVCQTLCRVILFPPHSCSHVQLLEGYMFLLFERSMIAALSYGMSFFESRFMSQLFNLLRPLQAVDPTGRIAMLTVAYELTRRQNRPQDPPGAGGNFDSPPDTAAAAGVDDGASEDPIIIDSDTEPMAESDVEP